MALRIPQCRERTRKHDFTLKATGNQDLEVFAKTDFAAISTTGGQSYEELWCSADATVPWSSKAHTCCVAMSSTEAEYLAPSDAV